MIIKYKNREIEVEFDSNSREMEDIYFSAGIYTDTMIDLTDEELDELQNECGDVLYEAWFDKQATAADFLGD